MYILRTAITAGKSKGMSAYIKCLLHFLQQKESQLQDDLHIDSLELETVKLKEENMMLLKKL